MKGGEKDMAMYIAEKILRGEQDYKKIFGISIYRKYQNDVDTILIAESREDLIIE